MNWISNQLNRKKSHSNATHCLFSFRQVPDWVVAYYPQQMRLSLAVRSSCSWPQLKLMSSGYSSTQLITQTNPKKDTKNSRHTVNVFYVNFRFCYKFLFFSCKNPHCQSAYKKLFFWHFVRTTNFFLLSPPNFDDFWQFVFAPISFSHCSHCCLFPKITKLSINHTKSHYTDIFVNKWIWIL